MKKEIKKDVVLENKEQQEKPKQKEIKQILKNNKILYYIILGVVVFLLVGAIFAVKNIVELNNETKQTEKTETQKEDISDNDKETSQPTNEDTNKEENESTNEDTNKENNNQKEYPKHIVELSSKIDTLLLSHYVYKEGEMVDDDPYSIVYGLYFTRTGILKNQLTNVQKQHIVLQSIDWGKECGEDWKKNEYYKKIYGSNPMEGCVYQVSEDDVNAHSKKLFGHAIDKPIEVINKNACYEYVYDATQKLYFLPAPACGGTGVGKVHTYKSKIITDTTKKEAYVYMSFAYTIPNPNDNYKTEIVYKDFDHAKDYDAKNEHMQDRDFTLKNEYKLTEEEQKKLNDYNINYNVINENNYTEFSEYKFTFKQDNSGNYYFIKVEQTK